MIGREGTPASWPGTVLMGTMRGRDQISLEAIDRFGAAALEPSNWLPALQSLADATRSARGQLVGIGGPAAIPFNWVTGFPDDALAEFVAIDGGNPAINPRVAAAARFPSDEVVFEKHYDAVRPHLKSSIYADFSATHDIPHGCQAVIGQGADGMVGLAVLRTARDGTTSEEDRAAFARIVPHVRAAVRLQVALEQQGAKLVAGAFETMGVAAFLCDGAGKVVSHTPSADRLLSQRRLKLSGGVLLASIEDESGKLRRAINRVATVPPDQPPPPSSTVMLRGAPGEMPLLAEIARLPTNAWTFGAGARVLVVVKGRKPRSENMVDALMAAYGLSQAEADVALRLLDAEGRETIAAARGVSLDTVRAQIKAIFAKLEVNREVELISRLAPIIHGG
ncbi:hypothetical protein ACFB49_08570 [Sphingomonas sp. DBB INV C78]